MKKKTVLIVLSILLLAGLLAGSLYLRSIREYKEKVNAITFTDIDLGTVADGEYEGSCDTGIVNATVVVTVRDHTIADIALTRHDNGRGTPAEATLGRMVREQTTDVDAVSGATCSSKVIRKAAENALAKGIREEQPADGPAVFTADPADLVGPWHLAEGENDDAAVHDTFPGSMEFGSVMEIGSDGQISWYIGADGGEGTCTVSGNVIRAELTIDGSATTMELTAEETDGQLRLTMVHKGLQLRWAQGRDETGKGD